MANRAIEFDQFVHTLLSLFLRLLSSFFRFLLLIRIKGEGQLTVEQATQVYDLFEAVVETELESLRALLISIEVGKWVEVALCVSAADPLCGLRARFPDLEWEQDEDGLQYVTRKLERSRG